MVKTHDLAAKVGEYTDKDGNKKGRYVNAGSIMKGEDNTFILLNRTFNPAGVPNPENRDTVLISMFPVQKSETAKKVSNTFENPFDDATPF